LHRYDFSFALSLTGTFGPPKEERWRLVPSGPPVGWSSYVR
jgi:hypothetical protein